LAADPEFESEQPVSPIAAVSAAIQSFSIGALFKAPG